MTLPPAAPVSTFTDSDAPQVDELPADYEPTTEDFEWFAACHLDTFLPHNLPFADWLAEKARQTALLDDDRSQWLSGRVDELAKQCHFLGARDPQEFSDRDEAMLRPCGRRPWVAPSIAAIGGIADWLHESYPETAATLRRHLRVLERAAGGAQ